MVNSTQFDYIVITQYSHKNQKTRSKEGPKIRLLLHSVTMLVVIGQFSARHILLHVRSAKISGIFDTMAKISRG